MAGAVAVMAKKKRDPKPSSAREDFIRVRLSTDFKAWLQRYADHRNLTMTDTIVQALIRDARAEKFAEPPPKR